jgi:hypothetical protein
LFFVFSSIITVVWITLLSEIIKTRQFSLLKRISKPNSGGNKMYKDKREVLFLGLTIVALLFAAMFLENQIAIQEKELNKATTFGVLKSKTIFLERPRLGQSRTCGNGVCEHALGETPLSCPEDCPV